MNREYEDPKPESIQIILTQLQRLKQIIIDEINDLNEEDGSDEEFYVELDDI